MEKILLSFLVSSFFSGFFGLVFHYHLKYRGKSDSEAKKYSIILGFIVLIMIFLAMINTPN